MKKLLFFLVLVSAAQAANSFVKLGDTPSGSRWKMTYEYDGTAYTAGAGPFYAGQRIYAYTQLGGANTVVVHDQSFGAPGYNYGGGLNVEAKFTITFEFTIAVGEARYFRLMHHCGGAWVTDWEQNLPASVAGTYTGATNPWRTTVKYFNDKPYPVTLKLLKNGTEVGQYTVAANTLFGQTFETWDATQPSYSVLVQVDGLAYGADGSWSAAPSGTIHTALNSSINPNNVVNNEPVGSTPTPQGTATVPTATNLPGAMPTPASVASVWRAPTTSAASGDALTNAVFREGIDKVVAKQNEQIAQEKEAETKRQADRDAAAVAKQAWENYKNSDLTTFVAEKNQAAGNSTVSALGGTSATASSVGSGSSQLTVQLPRVSQPTDIAPWATAAVHDAAGLVKKLLTLFLTVGFTVWLSKEIREMMQTILTAPQGRGNTVAGTGGQITGLIAAGIISAVVLGAPVAFAAINDASLGWRTAIDIVSPFTTSGTLGATALDLMNEFFPIMTAVGVLTQTYFTRVMGMSIMIGACAAIRWTVPVIVLGVSLAAASQAEAAVRIGNSVGGGTSLTLAAPPSMSTIATIADGASYDADAVAGSTFVAYTSTGAVWFEALDGAFVDVRVSGGSLSANVAHPSGVWWAYILKGFVVGCMMEAGGLAYRLLYRIKGSHETV